MQNEHRSKIIHKKVKKVQRLLFPTTELYSQGCKPKLQQDNLQQRVIGQDYRVKLKQKQYPISAIGHLYIKKSDNSLKKRTAFLIGVDLVMTALQNIYDKNGNRYNHQSLTYVPAGSQVIYKVIKCYYPDNNSQKERYDNDYAILRLEYPLGIQCGYFGLDFRGFTTTQAYLFGAPDSIYSNQQKISAEGQIYGGAGKIINNQQNNQILHRIPTSNGQEGSPLFQITQNGDDYLVIGISHGYISQQKLNSAFVISQKVQKNLNKWFKYQYVSFDLQKNPFQDNHQLTKQQLKQLTTNLQKLQILNLQHHRIDNEGLRWIKNTGWNLIQLNLNDVKLNLDGLRIIVSVDWLKIKELRLCQNNIRNQGCQIIAKGQWPNLHLLSLEENHITSKGINSLKKGSWPYLLYLSLSKNQIGSQGVDNLINTKWPRLKKIWVINSGVSMQGVEKIKKNWRTITVFKQEEEENQNIRSRKETKTTNASSND